MTEFNETQSNIQGLSLGNYRLQVDVETTRAYYAAHSGPWVTCTCAGCRNFVRAVKSLPQPVKDFFVRLGLDPEKVNELCYYNGTRSTVIGDGWYHLAGTVLEGSSRPGDHVLFPAGWYDLAEGFSVGFQNHCDLLPEDFPRPCFQMHFNYTLPWVLEEPNPYLYE